MKMKLAQLGAIVRYEAWMQWRRRGLLVSIVGLTVVMLGTGLMVKSSFRASDQGVNADLARQMAASGITLVGPMAFVVLTLTLPPVLADVIPKDRYIGVRELLDSLPLSPGVYLAGKVLGVFASVMSGLAGVALLVGVVWWLLFGPFALRVYVEMWIAGVGPLAFFISGMSALLPSGQPTRRRAASVGVAFTAYCFLTIAVTDASGLGMPRSGTWWSIINPAAWLEVLLDNILQHKGTSLLVAFPQQVPRMIAAAVLQVVVVWLIVWVWLYWREGR